MAFYIFSETELTKWKILNREEKAKSFFTRWVSREAFLKASGKGWCGDQKGLIFNDKKRVKKENLNDEATNCYLFECIPGYASALFVEGALLMPRYYTWNQNILRRVGKLKLNL